MKKLQQLLKIVLTLSLVAGLQGCGVAKALGWFWDDEPVDQEGVGYIVTTPPEASKDNTATFEFIAPDGRFPSAGEASYECRLDGGDWFPCTSPYTTPELEEGSHTFDVRAGEYPWELMGSWTWTVDLTAPEVVIDSAPNELSPDINPQILFTASDNLEVATVECKFDTDAWKDCSSPYKLTEVEDGDHTVLIRASDTAGNFTAFPAGVSWLVDANPPLTYIIDGPNEITNTNDIRIEFDAEDASTQTDFECSHNGEAWKECLSPVVLLNLDEGPHTFAMRAVDPLGNIDPSPPVTSWTVDTINPETIITAQPDSVVYTGGFNWDFESNEMSVTYECQIDNNPWQSCSPPEYINIADGTHTFKVRAFDAAGNQDFSPAVSNWVVDLVRPETSLTSAPPSLTNVTEATFVFSGSDDDGVDYYECDLDSTGYQNCASPYVVHFLNHAAHNMQIRAVDIYDRVDSSPLSINWTVDLVPPLITVTDAPSGTIKSDSANFAFTIENPATKECRLNYGSWTACTSSFNVGPVTRGTHNVEIRATDPIGNINVESRSWYALVNEAPILFVNAEQYGTGNAEFSGSITSYDADGDTVTYEVVTGPTSGSLDFNANSGLFIYTPINNFEGEVSFTVRATDTIDFSAYKLVQFELELLEIDGQAVENAWGGFPIYIFGKGFGTSGKIYSGSTTYPVHRWEHDRVAFVLPVDLVPGSLQVTFVTSGITSPIVDFNVVPKIDDIEPHNPTAGATVVITGRNLSSNGVVKVEETPQVSASWSATSITFSFVTSSTLHRNAVTVFVDGVTSATRYIFPKINGSIVPFWDPDIPRFGQNTGMGKIWNGYGAIFANIRRHYGSHFTMYDPAVDGFQAISYSDDAAAPDTPSLYGSTTSYRMNSKYFIFGVQVLDWDDGYWIDITSTNAPATGFSALQGNKLVSWGGNAGDANSRILDLEANVAWTGFGLGSHPGDVSLKFVAEHYLVFHSTGDTGYLYNLETDQWSSFSFSDQVPGDLWLYRYHNGNFQVIIGNDYYLVPFRNGNFFDVVPAGYSFGGSSFEFAVPGQDAWGQKSGERLAIRDLQTGELTLSDSSTGIGTLNVSVSDSGTVASEENIFVLNGESGSTPYRDYSSIYEFDIHSGETTLAIVDNPLNGMNFGSGVNWVLNPQKFVHKNFLVLLGNMSIRIFDAESSRLITDVTGIPASVSPSSNPAVIVGDYLYIIDSSLQFVRYGLRDGSWVQMSTVGMPANIQDIVASGTKIYVTGEVSQDTFNLVTYDTVSGTWQNLGAPAGNLTMQYLRYLLSGGEKYIFSYSKRSPYFAYSYEISTATWNELNIYGENHMVWINNILFYRDGSNTYSYDPELDAYTSLDDATFDANSDIDRILVASGDHVYFLDEANGRSVPQGLKYSFSKDSWSTFDLPHSWHYLDEVDDRGPCGISSSDTAWLTCTNYGLEIWQLNLPLGD